MVTTLPKHLRTYIDTNKIYLDEQFLNGHIRCKCGKDVFQVFYPGATYSDDETVRPITREIDGQFFFLIRLKCISCHREFLLFDKDFHGWNAIVSPDNVQTDLPRPQLTIWHCSVCGKIEHTVEIKLELVEKESFNELIEAGFNENIETEVFEWFWASITCVHCGLQTKDWIAYETT